VEKVRRAARDARVIDWLRVVVPKAGMVETISEGRMLIDAARSGAHGPMQSSSITTVTGRLAPRLWSSAISAAMRYERSRRGSR
jgi:hypothetical protein